jgi:lipopolysaccharide export system protein LptA
MWQGGDSVTAPVLELTRTPQTLKAYGGPASAAPAVEASLISASGSDHRPGVIRVHSRTFFYSDPERRGDFRGDVVAQNASGVIHADQAQVYLAPAAKPSSQAEARQSQLDRIIATGHVLLTGPGRRGTGEKLVYTTANGNYVLTGSVGNPPRVEDAAKGTTTGSTLIFNSQDDSVVVSGGQSSAVTETRSPK